MAQPSPRFIRPGQFLFREGDPSKSLFLVKKGTIAIRKRKGGAHVEIARVYANEVLGELSFFDRQPRSASAVALTEVEVVEIEFTALDKIFRDIPGYMKTIIAALAERLRRANDMIRRLQKNVVDEDEGIATDAPDEMDAMQVMAATSLELPAEADSEQEIEESSEEKPQD